MRWNAHWASSPESWLPVWVLPCDSGTPLWTPLLQMDKIISEVTEDCDSMYLPQWRCPPRGTPITLPCCLGPWGPRWTEGQGAGSACHPSWALELYHGSADALSTAST